MKHRFVLDENVLYFAVRLTNRKNEEDVSSARLIQLIGQNCHRIVLHPEITKKMYRQLLRLRSELTVGLSEEAIHALVEMLGNGDKRDDSYDELPMLEGEEKFPAEDVAFARLAAVKQATLVTDDEALRLACTCNGIEALRPSEALERARDR